MYFYKYQSVNALSLTMLKRGDIYFASPEELNDSHECKPKYIFSGSEEVWSRFIHFILAKICIKTNFRPNSNEANKLLSITPSITKHIYKHAKKNKIELTQTIELFLESLNNSFTENFSTQEKTFILRNAHEYMHLQFKDQLSEKKYLCSFSTTATNQTMWAHYGDSDRGFLIIYTANENKVEVKSTLKNLSGYRNKGKIIELGIYDNETLELQEVKYRKIPAKVNAFHRLISKFHFTEEEHHYDVPETLEGEIQYMEEDSIGLTKFTDWKYEREIRLLFPTYTKIHSIFRTLQIDHKQIKGVVFGSKMHKKDIESVIMACYHQQQIAETKHDFIFLQATESNKQYEMIMQPVGVLNQNYPYRVPITPFKELSDDDKNFVISICKEISEKSSLGNKSTISKNARKTKLPKIKL